MTEILFISLAVFLRITSSPAGNVFQKHLTGRGSHPLVVNFLTYALLSGVCFFFAVGVDWDGLPKAFWMYSLLAGVVGALGNGFLVRALQQGELSILGPVNSYKSIVGVVFGIFLLGEVPNLWGVLGMGLIIFGSYFVLSTTPEKFSWKLMERAEIRFRLWAMVLTAIEAIFIKNIIKASSTPIAFMSWCFFGAAFSFLLLFVHRLNPAQEMRRVRRSDIPFYFYLVLCMGIMQLTTNYVFEHMAVGYALALFQLSTLVSVLLGYRIYREENIRKKVIGSVIMLVGSVMIILLRATE